MHNLFVDQMQLPTLTVNSGRITVLFSNTLVQNSVRCCCLLFVCCCVSLLLSSTKLTIVINEQEVACRKSDLLQDIH